MNCCRKYNSGVNIIGSIPDYVSMIDFIVEEYTGTPQGESFQFRSSKSLRRFIAGIDESILCFANEKHKCLFFSALSSPDYTVSDKLLMVFWQMTYGNILFREITEEVFLKSLFSGRTTLTSEDIYSFVRHLRKTQPDEIEWSDLTIKTVGSKYLTSLKKFGLADGGTRKQIHTPSIGSQLFVYFVRWCLTANPADLTIDNRFMQFAFLDKASLISKLKRIEYIPYWEISQMNDNIEIELKPYE